MKEIKGIQGKQFFISTHSSVFLDSNAADRIYYIENTEAEGIRISDQTKKSIMIGSLGYSVSENLVSDLLILTEGPTDSIVLKHFLKKKNLLDSYNVKFWPLGGDIMSQLDLSVFSEHNNVFALIDNDPGSSVIRTRFEKQCKKNNVYCKRLKRYSIENYFTLTALRKTFPNRIPSKISTLDQDRKVDKQIGFEEKGKSIKAKIPKVLQKMNLDDIAGTDLMEFIDKIQKFFATG